MKNPQLIDSLNLAISNALSNVHTSLVAKITKVNNTTINCKPVVNRVVDGESIELPEFLDVPPLFMQGGGCYTAYPVSVGDYCLLIFSERCFDSWYAGQDFASPLEMRAHDYSDGFAIVGVNPASKSIPIPSIITTVGDSVITGSVIQHGSHEINGNLIINGTLTVNGDIECTGTLTVGGLGFSSHVHKESGDITGGPQ